MDPFSADIAIAPKLRALRQNKRPDFESELRSDASRSFAPEGYDHESDNGR